MKTVYKYGIDFGTTNSSIALVMENAEGLKAVKVFAVDTYDTPYEIIRSVVGYKSGKTYVGNEGLEFLNGNEDNPIKQVKLRLLASEGKDDLCLSDNGQRHYYSDIIAKILTRLKEKAEAQNRGYEISGVVMGVPNSTDQDVKSTYITALQKAGFYSSKKEAEEKTEFIEESVAVALHYGTKTGHQNKNALIFDFGGGTLDLAVVKMKRQSLSQPDENAKHKIIAKGRITGAGEKFTRLFFLKAFVPQYANQHCGGSTFEVAKLFRGFGFSARSDFGELWTELEDSGIGWQLINALDNAKISLSTSEKFVFHFTAPQSDNHGKVQFLPTTLTRENFEEAIEGELVRIEQEIKRLLSVSKYRKDDIDEVLMSGGSSLIPAVRKLLEGFFGKNKVYLDDGSADKSGYHLNVMTCIAQGLAYAGYKDLDYEYVDDVASFDYGIMDYEKGKIAVIVSKNTRISDTRFNYHTLQGGKSIEIEQLDLSKNKFFVEIYEGSNKIMRLSFNQKAHSGFYKLFFMIEAKRGILEVHIYDTVLMRWLDDIPVEERSFSVNSFSA